MPIYGVIHPFLVLVKVNMIIATQTTPFQRGDHYICPPNNKLSVKLFLFPHYIWQPLIGS